MPNVEKSSVYLQPLGLLRTMLFASRPLSVLATRRSTVWGHTCIRLDRGTRSYRGTLWTRVLSWQELNVVLTRWDSTYTNISYFECIIVCGFLLVPWCFCQRSDILEEILQISQEPLSSLLVIVSNPNTPPSLNRFALMENAAMHLSSELMSAMPSAMDTG